MNSSLSRAGEDQRVADVELFGEERAVCKPDRKNAACRREEIAGNACQSNTEEERFRTSMFPSDSAFPGIPGLNSVE